MFSLLKQRQKNFNPPVNWWVKVYIPKIEKDYFADTSEVRAKILEVLEKHNVYGATLRLTENFIQVTVPESIDSQIINEIQDGIKRELDMRVLAGIEGGSTSNHITLSSRIDQETALQILREYCLNMVEFRRVRGFVEITLGRHVSTGTLNKIMSKMNTYSEAA